jgi:NADH-quinone oxidoreductase subunit L
MLNGLWLTPLIPLAGFLLLALFGDRLQRRWVALIAVGSVGIVALLACIMAVDFYQLAPEQRILTQTLGTWFASGAS